jgi:hypothetical protein
MSTPDSVADAARQFLERIVGMYAGMDAGEGDPVHTVRVYAQERLSAGAKPSDPFTVCAMISDALPEDRHAFNLVLSWLDEYVRVLRRLQDGE